MSLLSCRGVEHGYTSGVFFRRSPLKRVLSGIDLTIEKGECLALLGESGSGKSTLGRLFLGLERPNRGTVSYRDRSLADLSGEDRLAYRRAVQVVFQDSISAIDPRFTISRSVEEPLRHLTKLDVVQRRQRIAELLALVSIDAGEATKLPSQVSGGQLQRVAIARALAPSPELIVLDEAVSNLDLTLQVKTLDLLAELRQRLGTAYLFITHDLRLARRFADRIAVLHEGRIVEEIPANGRLCHPAAQALEAAVLPSRPAKTRS